MRPKRRLVEKFIQGRSTKPSRDTKPVIATDVPSTGTRQGKEYSFTFKGKTKSFRNGKELLVGTLERLLQEDAHLYEKLEPHLEGYARRYLAKDRDEIYPDTELGETQAERLSSGYWIGTHSNNAQKIKQIKKACEIVGVEFGKDLVVKFGE